MTAEAEDYPPPGVFDHKGAECETCQEVTPHRRLAKSALPFVCVTCIEAGRVKDSTLETDPISEKVREEIADILGKTEALEASGEFSKPLPPPPDPGPAPEPHDFYALAGLPEFEIQRRAREARQKYIADASAAAASFVSSVLLYVESFRQ